jgi:hypothetical protein
LGDSPFKGGAYAVVDAKPRRIGTNSSVFNLRRAIQHEYLPFLNGGQAETQVRLSEQGAKFGL